MRAILRGLRESAAVKSAAGVLLGTLIALFVLPVLQDVFRRINPPGEWVTFRHLHVDDAVVGGPFIVTADRTVHQSTLARIWTTVRRKEAGGFVTVCKAYDERHLIPEQRFPDKVTLSYWTGPEDETTCEPEEPGVHIVTMWIEVSDRGGKTVSAIELKSNEFSVWPAP